ncbi:MAG TPA: hypothetical protein VM010_06620, partial [Chitinophagaceae bacterium]|nr:hypothetical protein [Chitinophagaceae bacterium]
GYKNLYYNKGTNEFNKEAILATVEAIQQKWQPKYPELKVKSEKLRFDSMLAFNQTFTSEVEYLNLETR